MTLRNQNRSKKSLFLDTSYLMPFVRIQVNKWTPEKLLSLMDTENFTIKYSFLSLFEIAAKAAKLLQNDSELSQNDIQIGLDLIKYNKDLIEIVEFYSPNLLSLAYTFRAIHSDFIDCMILAGAVCNSDIFCTFDHSFISKISQDQKSIDKILSSNEMFEIHFDDLAKPPIPFHLLIENPG